MCLCMSSISGLGSLQDQTSIICRRCFWFEQHSWLCSLAFGEKPLISLCGCISSLPSSLSVTTAAFVSICYFPPSHQHCLNQPQGFAKTSSSPKAFLCILHVAMIFPGFWPCITWLSNLVKESVRRLNRVPAFTFCLSLPTGSWRGCWRRVMIRRSSQWQLTTLENMCDITHVASGKASFCGTSKWLNAKSKSHHVLFYSVSLWNEGSLVLPPSFSPLWFFFFNFLFFVWLKIPQ